ncbi:hypothetical protein Bhyg_04390, partial [Pseudolycoriella hygida]
FQSDLNENGFFPERANFEYLPIFRSEKLDQLWKECAEQTRLTKMVLRSPADRAKRVKSLSSCRQVSRRWKDCAEQTRLKKLVLQRPAYRTTRVWYYSYLPVDDDDIIYILSFVECRNIPFSLEYLTALIIDALLTYGDISLLNLLQQLKHLEFSGLVYQEAPPPEITLPLLKVLKINFVVFGHDVSAIHAPNLEVLSCWTGLSGIRFPHSESVKKLQIADRQTLILNIFEYLGVKSLSNCRQVSRRWKESAEQARLKKVVLRCPDYRATRAWYYSYLPVDDDDIIYILSFVQCRNIPFSLVYLTALIIDIPLTYRDVSLLNLLQQLKHLEFQNLTYQEAPPPQIRLPLLNVLRINCAAYNRDGIAVHAPNLEVLSCMTGLSGIRFPHSESVKKLQIADRQTVNRFKNVEVFSCFNSVSIVSDLFVQLPKKKLLGKINLKLHFLGVKSLTNCRQVSRRWKECAEQARLKKVVLRCPDYRATRAWYYSYLPVDDDDIIYILSFDQCRNIPFSLEYLTALIIDTPLTYGDVSILNLLQQLKHLELPNLMKMKH